MYLKAPSTQAPGVAVGVGPGQLVSQVPVLEQGVKPLQQGKVPAGPL